MLLKKGEGSLVMDIVRAGVRACKRQACERVGGQKYGRLAVGLATGGLARGICAGVGFSAILCSPYGFLRFLVVACGFLVGFLWVPCGHVPSEFLQRLALENEEHEKHSMCYIVFQFHPDSIRVMFLPNSIRKRGPLRPQRACKSAAKTSARIHQETTRHPQDHARNAQGTEKNTQGLASTTLRATPATSGTPPTTAAPTRAPQHPRPQHDKPPNTLREVVSKIHVACGSEGGLA